MPRITKNKRYFKNGVAHNQSITFIAIQLYSVVFIPTNNIFEICTRSDKKTRKIDKKERVFLMLI
jgi:hypothetical protein